MAELVECARLEIAYSGNTIEGSNPPISAIKIKLPFGQFYFYREYDLGIRRHNEVVGFVAKPKGTREYNEWELQSPYLRHK